MAEETRSCVQHVRFQDLLPQLANRSRKHFLCKGWSAMLGCETRDAIKAGVSQHVLVLMRSAGPWHMPAPQAHALPDLQAPIKG